MEIIASGELSEISTHAPAGGATGFGKDRAALERISTHAPAGGATGTAGTLRAEGCDFYSRPCGRGDQYQGAEYDVLFIEFLLTPLREGRRESQAAAGAGPPISTHAPAGGATTPRG